MKNFLLRANQALLEGDRDGALKILEDCPSTIEVLWIRAQCVIGEREQSSLLEEIYNSNQAPYAAMAGAILERELEYDRQLKQPPDYQFWKRSTWQERWQQLREQRSWFFGILGILVISIFVIASLITSGKRADEAAFLATQTMQAYQMLPTHTPRPSPTVTSIAPVGPAIYDGGQLSIIRYERDTRRPVVPAGSYNQEEAARPASGALFWAFQYEFICRKPVCDNPPQVERVVLKLAGGGERDSSLFVLREFPAADRVADGVVTSGWLVFEVPASAEPETFQLFYDRENHVDLVWKP